MEAIDVEAEKKLILNKYRKLLRHSKPFLKDNDAKIIKKAFNTSLEAHKEMRRKSGEPYILHPVAVAQICVEEIGLGTTAIVSALLHDVVEDTELEVEDVKREFGDRVALIIDGLTKIAGAFEYGSSQQAENFRKMLLTLSHDVRVILIKLADRLHNMRTLESMPRNKQLKIASETMYLYAPLAHRLGLYAIKSELEDLHLKYFEKEDYKEIVNKIAGSKDARDRFIRKFIKPIQKELKALNLDFEIKGRPKSIHSVWNKMKMQDIPFEEVFDLFAVRIIVNSDYEEEKADCWKVYSIVTDFYKPNPDRLRDWVSTPKSNGYESLHTTVMSDNGQWVEVQIRTKRMDEIAEKGYAAHWKYKDDSVKPESGLEQWITKVRQLLEENDASAIEFVDDFKSNLFSDEVFVFTPEGELKTLPHGASALDFAFEIHTEVGQHCLGAKVNSKLVPINHILNNGDQVEILTSVKQKPNEGWLQYVKTSKARSKIKESLREELKLASSEGKETIYRKFRQLKITPNQESLDQLRAYFDVKTISDLYSGIANGKLDAKNIKVFKAVRAKYKSGSKGKISDAKTFVSEISKIKGKKQDVLFIGEDMDTLDYTLAVCCNPISGDDVFGFVTVNEGIKIHRTSCPNAVELMSHYGYRIVKAKWASKKETAFQIGLKIIGTDRVGLINDITNVISSELKVNMSSIAIDTDTGIFDGSIKLYINDTKHLDLLIKRLEKVQGIVNITRYDVQ